MLELVITLVVAVIGTVLLLLLYSRIRQIQAEWTLKKHRSKNEGLADLLNYAAVVDDGVIVCKNGAFMACWLYQGSDNASATDAEREQVSLRINQAVLPLGNGWMFHVDAVRHPAPKYPDRNLSAFPDEVSAAIDEERRRLFEGLGTMYEGYFVLSVTWFPPVLAQRKFVELMFDDDNKVTNQTDQTEALIEQFKREVLNLENRLSSTLKLTRLHGHQIVNEDGSRSVIDDQLSWLQYCITGIHQPVRLPRNPIYLDALIGGQELWSGVVPKIGRNFIQVVAIDGFPMESFPGILSDLAELAIEYRWSSRFIFMDQEEATQQLDKFRKKWRQKIRGFFDQVFGTSEGPIDQDALSMVADAEAAIAEIKSNLIAEGYYTSNIVLMDEDRGKVEAAARKVQKTINRLGFVARIETLNTMDAFLGTLPGHGVENVRRPLMNTLNFADLLPTSTIWTGNPQAPCPTYPPMSPGLMQVVTSGATPFWLNLHVRDLGHTFMFGPTGAGKSTHLGIIAAQLLRYKGMEIYSFDKGMSMYPLTKAVGGLHFSIAANDSKLAFCPLQFLETAGDRAWASEWIDTIIRLNGIDTSPEQRNAIAQAISSMAESGARTLSEFSLTIQDAKIRDVLKPYTIDGLMGHLLDAQKDGLAFSTFTTFEIEDLMNLGEKYALPVLLYIFRRIECSLHGQPAVIILDEAWLMLGHPVFREKIREWLKVLRKANCLVLMATQSLSDAANSGILDVIVESTATKIFLPNVYARDEDTAALYKRMGLNDRQIEIIAQAVPKRHYYLVSEQGRRLYELGLGPLALSFVGATDKDSIADIQKLEKKYGSLWVNEWLARRGLNLRNYKVNS